MITGGLFIVRSLLPAVLTVSITAALLVTGPVAGSAAPATEAAAASSSRFVPLSPTRVLDTRTGLGGAGPVGGGRTITLDLAGRLPADATAVVLNLTGVTPTANTYVTAFPSDANLPVVSNLNLAPGETRANLVTVAVGSARAVGLYNNAGDTHLVADLAGYYTTGSGSLFTARQAERVLATHAGPGGTAVVDLTARVPASATSVVVTVTGANSTGDTFLTAWPTGTTRPLASTVNVAPGKTNPNLATVTLGAGRRISVYNNAGDIDVLVDLAGFYSPEFGAAFVPVTPSRVLDTRDGTGTFGNEARPLAPGEHATVHPGTAVPDDAVALAVNLTGIQPTASTFVSAWLRQWDSVPTTSNLNLAPGQTAANLAVVPTRSQYPGQGFYLYNNAGDTHVAGDLAGYFTVPPAPCTADCLYAWGANAGGAGVGTTDFATPTPTPVRGLSGVVSSSGRYALRSDGTVWGWGDNDKGQLGNGWTGGESPVPVRVAGLTNVVAVAESWRSGFALRSDGTVWGWGANWYNLIGDPGQSDSTVPVRLPDLSGITAIAAGNSTAYALRSDGTVWAWGGNDAGQLGDGSTVWATWDPVRVTGLTGITSIAGGYSTAAAIRSDGTVWTWGNNRDHQLGNGTDVPESRVPVQVSGLTGATDVSMDFQHGFAVRTDGTVWAWGNNRFGGLGNGVACDWVDGPECTSSVPVQVSNLTNVVAVAGMFNAGAALDAAGQVWVWGANTSGEFGDGTVGYSDQYAVVPRQVPGLTGVSSLQEAMFGARALVPGSA
jgi:alpha-tubulin suppressor-like RCC1 family protein